MPIVCGESLWRDNGKKISRTGRALRIIFERWPCVFSLVFPLRGEIREIFVYPSPPALSSSPKALFT
jgi:hypothetical protein